MTPLCNSRTKEPTMDVTVSRLIPMDTRFRLIAARAGLKWSDVRELTFLEFARR